MTTYTPSSEKIVHETSVDFKKRPVVEPIHIVQYDNSLPIVAVTLYSDYELYSLPSSASANIKVKKPDGKFVYNEVLGCNSDRTVIYFEVTAAMTSFYGELHSVIEIVVNGGVAASANITLVVDKNPVQSDDVESTDEYLALIEYTDSAAASAKAAAASEANAKTYAANAKSSATAAAASETNAKESEVKAAEYAKIAGETELGSLPASLAQHILILELMDSDGEPILSSDNDSIETVTYFVDDETVRELEERITILENIITEMLHAFSYEKVNSFVSTATEQIATLEEDVDALKEHSILDANYS
ncbi:MAG: hypothetical protein LUD27_06645 [Clostridia bacterium]|nr:hypothetical protein [Clostridia bacterium]